MASKSPITDLIRNIKSKLKILAVLLFITANVSAQDIIGYLELAGRTKKDNKDLSGARITLYKNNMFEKEIITGRNGKFKFYIDYGYNYKITFNYPECVEMHLLIFAKIPRDKYSLMPYYELGNIPFFETNNNSINLEKYKEPFTKIVFDGYNIFKDDDEYLDEFVKDIYLDPLSEAKAEAEKIAKEKAEQRAKREAEEKMREEMRVLAELKIQEEAEAILRAEELTRLKEEEEKQAVLSEQSNQALSVEEIKLLQEKEAKAALDRKNKSIKTEYENTLLAIVAENEKLDKQQFKEVIKEMETNSVIERMRVEASLKSKADYLREQQLTRNKSNLLNQQLKTKQGKKLLEAGAFAERAVKINNQTDLPETSQYSKKTSFNVSVIYKDEFWKKVKTTTVTIGNHTDAYRKEIYIWGSEYFYKNNTEINDQTYKTEISKYIFL